MKEKTKELLLKNNLHAVKRFGQNFLVDDEVLLGIVKASNTAKNDLVIEIGPGLGNLTEYLVEASKKVIAVELDVNMVEVLKQRFAGVNNLELVTNDILKTDINKMIKDERDKGNTYDNIRIIGNLPYYITTPIMFHLLESNYDIDNITVMIQKEVAQRIVSPTKSKDYGILTIMTNIYAEAIKGFDVKAESFIPAPKVDSSIIVLNNRKNKLNEIEDVALLRKLVKAAFSQRRKTILNSLSSSMFELGLNKEELKELLGKFNLSENTRAEEIEIDKYIEVSNYLNNRGSSK